MKWKICIFVQMKKAAGVIGFESKRWVHSRPYCMLNPMLDFLCVLLRVFRNLQFNSRLKLVRCIHNLLSIPLCLVYNTLILIFLHTMLGEPLLLRSHGFVLLFLCHSVPEAPSPSACNNFQEVVVSSNGESGIPGLAVGCVHSGIERVLVVCFLWWIH